MTTHFATSLAIIATLGLGMAHAATNMSYSASATPSANPDGNGGTINVWTTTRTTGDDSLAGFFQGNSADNGGGAGAGSSAWAMYANSNQEAFASHTFAGGALNSGQTVSLNFDHGSIATSKSTGIQLFNGTTLLFQLFFKGGESNYWFSDAGGIDQSTGAGFTLDGGTFSFKLNSATSYSATWRSASWSGTIANLAIDRIQVYNNSAGSGAGSDVYFNNLTVIPEPTGALLGVVCVMGLLRRRRA
jgi:hypothetical protein